MATKVVYRTRVIEAPKSKMRDADLWIAYLIRGVIVASMGVAWFWLQGISTTGKDTEKAVADLNGKGAAISQKVDDLKDQVNDIGNQVKALWGRTSGAPRR